MGHDVHLHVAFNANANEGVAALADKHLRLLDRDARDTWEAGQFLLSLSVRTGRNPGPKGGLSLWGMVGNHTDGDRFCEVLRPFWSELLSNWIEGGPHPHERVLVFEEQEQSERAVAHEIAFDEDTGELTITRHECPFAWMQY
jgi:hypothetical protein